LNHAIKYGKGGGCPSSRLGGGWRNDLFSIDQTDSTYPGDPGMTCKSDTDWVNDYDQAINIHDTDNYFLSGVVDSIHDDHREDRRWKFKWCKPEGNVISNRYSPSLTGSSTSEYDSFGLTKECPGSESAIIGFYSVHDNHYEDRIWNYRCGILDLNKYVMTDCDWSYLFDTNDVDERFSYLCPNNGVIAGVKSYHYDKYEDRVFSYKCCTIKLASYGALAEPVSLILSDEIRNVWSLKNSALIGCVVLTAVWFICNLVFAAYRCCKCVKKKKDYAKVILDPSDDEDEEPDDENKKDAV